jgi:hypothetical protein
LVLGYKNHQRVGDGFHNVEGNFIGSTATATAPRTAAAVTAGSRGITVDRSNERGPETVDREGSGHLQRLAGGDVGVDLVV